jgi:hypothetical protein
MNHWTLRVWGPKPVPEAPGAPLFPAHNVALVQA